MRTQAPTLALLLLLVSVPCRAQDAQENPGSESNASFLECLVEARIDKFEKRADVDAEIAKQLDLKDGAIGKLGVAMIEITVVKAAPKDGKNDACAKLTGNSGRIVAFYELSNKAVKWEKGEILHFDYWAFAGFAPYGVPGKEVWTIRPGNPAAVIRP